MVVHAASETFTMRDVAEVVQREIGCPGEPVSLSLAEALQFCPVAKALCQSHAISSEMAKKELDWKPSGVSILREVEVWARRWEIAGRGPGNKTKLTPTAWLQAEFGKIFEASRQPIETFFGWFENAHAEV
jgi:hypothetical protein